MIAVLAMGGGSWCLAASAQPSHASLVSPLSFRDYRIRSAEVNQSVVAVDRAADIRFYVVGPFLNIEGVPLGARFSRSCGSRLARY
jgi:hypothetical protein